MHPYVLDELARERTSELRRLAASSRHASSHRPLLPAVRRATGSLLAAAGRRLLAQA